MGVQDSMSAKASDQKFWIFAYGSLIWRPGFEWISRHRARADGFIRRFWQASPDHRGTPESPGRVVTLVPDQFGYCDGVAYAIEPDKMDETLAYLDDRESGGYEQTTVDLTLSNQSHVHALTYVGNCNNPHFLGASTAEIIAAHILVSKGPSGTNLDYLLSLERALSEWKILDEHVSQIINALPQKARRSLGLCTPD